MLQGAPGSNLKGVAAGREGEGEKALDDGREVPTALGRGGDCSGGEPDPPPCCCSCCRAASVASLSETTPGSVARWPGNLPRRWPAKQTRQSHGCCWGCCWGEAASVGERRGGRRAGARSTTAELQRQRRVEGKGYTIICHVPRAPRPVSYAPAAARDAAPSGRDVVGLLTEHAHEGACKGQQQAGGSSLEGGLYLPEVRNGLARLAWDAYRSSSGSSRLLGCLVL